MISRDIFNALPDKPNGSLRDAIIALLTENPGMALTPKEIYDNLGKPYMGLTFSDPVMSDLKKLVNEGTILKKDVGSQDNPYYALK